MEERSMKERSQEVNRRNPFVQLLGVEIVEISPDRSLLRLALRPELLNPHGLVHGGALFTLADNAAGCAASTDGRVYVTQESDIHFLRAQTPAPSRPRREGRRRGSRGGFQRPLRPGAAQRRRGAAPGQERVVQRDTGFLT